MRKCNKTVKDQQFWFRNADDERGTLMSGKELGELISDIISDEFADNEDDFFRDMENGRINILTVKNGVLYVLEAMDIDFLGRKVSVTIFDEEVF